MNNYDEVNLIEFLNILKKNRFFIMTVVIATIFFGLIISGVRILQNPVEYRYRSIATLELVNGEGMINQPQTVLLTMESSSVLDAAKYKLKLRSDDYSVRTEISTEKDQYNVIIEGPGELQVISLLDEVVYQSHDMTEGSMNMTSNEVVEAANSFGEPIKISKNVNVILNAMIDLILGVLLGILLVFFFRHISGKAYTKEETEKILNTNVLIEIPNFKIENKYMKFFRVR